MKLTLLSLLPLLASTSPLAMLPRAGGPNPTPIPANCTLINPLPHASTTTCSTNTTISGYKPSANFTAVHSLYASYFPPTPPESAQAEECMQQCYGYGYPGSCKAAVFALNVPTPKGYYGTAGGVLGAACLMFDAYLDPNSFVVAENGQWVNETAADIYCPSS